MTKGGKIPGINNKIDRKMMAGYIDHTILKPDATGRDIIRLCEEAAGAGFASVCINPVFVPLAVEKLAGTGVKVCTVIGFPLGANETATKVREAVLAVRQGAGEIDMVIRIGALKEGKYDIVGRDISEVVRSAREIKRDVTVKVIIETCFLTDEEKVKACQLAESAGVDFVKTSTGFGSGGATVPDVLLMRKSVSSGIGVKASGGIRTAAQAVKFIKAGATRLGTSAGLVILQELDK
ncbi:MAG: deoxyribose-phosphate aldolase [Eubacteriales bacterium]